MTRHCRPCPRCASEYYDVITHFYRTHAQHLDKDDTIQALYSELGLNPEHVAQITECDVDYVESVVSA